MQNRSLNTFVALSHNHPDPEKGTPQVQSPCWMRGLMSTCARRQHKSYPNGSFLCSVATPWPFLQGGKPLLPKDNVGVSPWGIYCGDSFPSDSSTQCIQNNLANKLYCFILIPGVDAFLRLILSTLLILNTINSLLCGWNQWDYLCSKVLLIINKKDRIWIFQWVLCDKLR